MTRLTHLPLRLTADPARVVIRPFHLPPAAHAPNGSRTQRIFDAVEAMDMETCRTQLALVARDFDGRHWQTRKVFLERYKRVTAELELADDAPQVKKELIGAYFCHEYSYAAAAVMNPSIVAHPDQSGLSQGALRFILSVRAVGEGHISSIAFREGIIGADGLLSLMSEPPFATAATLKEAPAANGRVTVQRNEDSSLSGTVMFPFTPAQRNGLEDLRLLRFQDEDAGEEFYCGTYTAYSGSAIGSEVLLTRDFRTFDLEPMRGAAARNKGMALFPRRIEGRYAMIGRQDGENLFFLQSDDLTAWESGEILMKPVFPWELVQIGNCGAPIEIEEGWLLLTHGVGAMRQYCIGAALLDKADPRKILARTKAPLISPSDETREGYVPNVVYTCGALALGRTLYLPYAVADSAIAFGTMDLNALVADLV